VTVRPTGTLLQQHYLALEQGGLTFTDVSTALLAPRPQLHIQMQDADISPAAVVEIPAQDSEKPFVVTHTFNPEEEVGSYNEMAERIMENLQGVGAEEAAGLGEDKVSLRCGLSPGEELRASLSQSTGLEVGREYEIGLGDELARVVWWRVGGKQDVFDGDGKLRGPRVIEQPKLKMRLVESARFEVVE